MDLKLEERFNTEELNEIRKRVFSFADQMFLEGVSVGRELNRDLIYGETEQFVRDKLSAMTAYFVTDSLWTAMPPHGYNPDPSVDIPKPSDAVASTFGKSIKRSITGECNAQQKPEDVGLVSEEKPDWVKEVEKAGLLREGVDVNTLENL
jgi:hypothetical protein